MKTNVSLAHREQMIRHLEGQSMGLKYTVETIGELRKALAGIPDHAYPVDTYRYSC